MSQTTAAAVDRLERDLGELLEVRDRDATSADLTRFASDILGFVTDQWPDLFLTTAQRAHLVAVQDHTRVAAYGGNGLGKTLDDALIACWAIWACHALVIATSAIERQLTDQFMRDFRRLFHSSRSLYGVLHTLGIRRLDNPDSGLMCMASGSEHNLRSYHAPRVMVQLHEAQGLPPFAFESAELMAVGAWDRVTATGNSTNPNGPFHKRCMSWPAAIRFDSRDHPNILEGRTVIPGGPTRESLAQRARDYGADSPFYLSSVTGAFPSESAESLIRRAWIPPAQLRWRGPVLEFTPQNVPEIGVDIAALGGDRTVFAVRSGRSITHVLTLPVSDTMTTVAAIMSQAEQLGIHIRHKGPRLSQPQGYMPLSTVRVDAVGIGAGVADRLIELGVQCERFVGSASPRHGGRIVTNARTEAYWTLHILLERGELALPPDEFLIEELLSMTCRPNATSGLMQLDDKDLFRAGHKGKSPDRADAVSLACYGLWRPAGSEWRTFDATEVLGW